MGLEAEINLNDAVIQKINDDHLNECNIQFDILRLDQIHPVVSGNKWFKLKYYLQDAIENNYTSVATFGGAYSNHILATAYACNKLNIPCTGFIRGERPEQYSQTLLDAAALHMEFVFLAREDYKNKQAVIKANPALFFIPEGGYGKTGVKGAAEILNLVPDLFMYNYIVCASGTGTMLAGILNGSLPHQQCIGISAMKNNFSLENETITLLNEGVANRVKIVHDYHFGGYAKYAQQLIDFMNNEWKKQALPLDFVYTAKALYAVYDLSANQYFPHASRILFIHSGGLQGNRSLQKHLLFSGD